MSSDSIASSYKNIQNNIALVESGNFNSAIIKAIEIDFYNLMDGIKIYLITNKDTYYGTFFLNLSFEADFNSNSIAGIRLNAFPPVFVSNPLLLCKFSIKEIMFIVCHEIEHIILRHPIEMVKMNPYKDPNIFELFNYAADASVNDRIENEMKRMNYKFLKKPDSIIDSAEFAKIFSIKNIMPVESYIYYFNLIKDKAIDGMDNPKERLMNGFSNDSGETEDDPIEHVGDQQNQEDGNSDVVTANNTQEFSDHNWDESTDIEEMEANLREYVKQSYNQMSKKMKGSLPGYIKEEIEKCNEAPVISWQSLLKKYVGTVSAKAKPTRMKLNRRQPTRFDLSGKTNDKVLKITVAVDTSGSMTNRELSYAFNEIFSILRKKTFKLTVIEFDDVVQKEYSANSIGDIDLNVLGRGGTSFQNLIKHINKDKKFRDTLLIIFTDGFAESVIDHPNVYKLLWVITGKKEDLSVKEPYGMVLELDKGFEDYEWDNVLKKQITRSDN